MNALGDVLQYDLSGLKEGEEKRVRKLIADLSPQDAVARVRFLVTEMPWDYPVEEGLEFDKREKRQVEIVRALAREMLTQPGALRGCLADLSVGEQRMSVALAKQSPSWRMIRCYGKNRSRAPTLLSPSAAEIMD